MITHTHHNAGSPLLCIVSIWIYFSYYNLIKRLQIFHNIHSAMDKILEAESYLEKGEWQFTKAEEKMITPYHKLYGCEEDNHYSNSTR